MGFLGGVTATTGAERVLVVENDRWADARSAEATGAENRCMVVAKFMDCRVDGILSRFLARIIVRRVPGASSVANTARLDPTVTMMAIESIEGDAWN
jgi:hypothetical protein